MSTDQDDPEVVPEAKGLIDFTNPRVGWIFIAAFSAGIIALGLFLT